MTTPWYNDIFVLGKRPLEFFPTRDHSPAEKLNSIVRFVAYGSAAIAVYRRDTTPLLVGVLVIAVLSFVFSVPQQRNLDVTISRYAADKRDTTCTKPTQENPFMNRLPHEHGSDKAPACPQTDEVRRQAQQHFDRGLPREVSDVYRNRASDRQFMTMPVTDTIPDTLAFRNFLAGK